MQSKNTSSIMISRKSFLNSTNVKRNATHQLQVILAGYARYCQKHVQLFSNVSIFHALQLHLDMRGIPSNDADHGSA
eukprot:scaffold13725_cov44-Cyclotella_meneghiniana.AAC.5